MLKPQCLPILIGSFPFKDHLQAVDAILSHTPEIPLWPQLPKLAGEGMVRQFLTGFPGLQDDGSRFWVDTDAEDFAEQMASFYTEYMEVESDPSRLADSSFALGADTAQGFGVFSDTIRQLNHQAVTLKGQVTGPVTAGIGLKDQNGQSIFYDENLRDMLIKLIALKGCWQIAQFKALMPHIQPIIFIDEPAIVSFGSTGFMGVTKEMVSEAVALVVSEIQQAGGQTGVHICANGDWEPALSSAADIISFDAYFYFDNFVLYREQLVSFIERGGILAWGIVPTGDQQILDDIDIDTLFGKWLEQLDSISSFGFSKKRILQQTFIAPSCGTGSLYPDQSLKVLRLTREISKRSQKLMQSF